MATVSGVRWAVVEEGVLGVLERVTARLPPNTLRQVWVIGSSAKYPTLSHLMRTESQADTTLQGQVRQTGRQARMKVIVMMKMIIMMMVIIMMMISAGLFLQLREGRGLDAIFFRDNKSPQGCGAASPLSAHSPHAEQVREGERE